MTCVVAIANGVRWALEAAATFSPWVIPPFKVIGSA